MNRDAALSVRILLYLSLVFLVSCQKIHFEDFIHPDNTPKLCKVKRIISYADLEFFADTLTRDFKYNNWGDPVSILLTPEQPGIPDFIFLYDNQHRLDDFVSLYKNNYFEQWHHYAYENNRVVRDTSRIFGTIVNGEPVADEHYAYHMTVTHLEYDSYNRIVKSSFIFQTSPEILTQVSTYTYNAVGNLAHYKVVVPEVNFTIREEFYTNYDKKTNIHRTHKVWMFIDRDYSINNRILAENYNQFGLPLKFRSPEGNYPFVYGHNISNSDIRYECK